MAKHTESVMVLGVLIKREVMPEIFRLARQNPRSIKLVLEAIMLKRGFVDPVKAMKLLEGDLGYKGRVHDLPINSIAGAVRIS